MMRILLVIGLLLAQPAVALAAQPTATPIDHFVVMMQSNHSFDNYFGTYPGADGVPAGVCMPHSTDNLSPDRCVRPFRLGDQSPADLDHRPGTQRAQYNAGKMNGFVEAYRKNGRDGSNTMGYYDREDLPYYWSMADRFTLFDRFFSSTPSGTRQNRTFWVAGVPATGDDVPTIFDRLNAQGVSWKFYVEKYSPDSPGQRTQVPLLNFPRFAGEPRIVDLSEYYRDLREGTLPAVAYVASSVSSENPPGRIQAGQSLVREMTTELARSRYWSSSAFLLTYDGWGGFYDHVAPPVVDENGYGFRVPALLMSPYSRRGHVDHTTADYTSVLRFIEDNWQLDPLGTRDAKAANLFSAFDFTSPPRAPELAGGPLAATPGSGNASLVVYSAYGFALLAAAACVAVPAGIRRRQR